VGVSGVRGGPVDGLSIAGAGNGNALVAFSQGDPDERQIAVARVNAPPVPFIVEPPAEWTNARRPTVAWQPPPNDPRPRDYTVRIDDRIVSRSLNVRTYRLAAGALPDGRHTVQVSATSRTGGGDTDTPVATFSTDRRRPSVRLTRRGRKVVVRIVDPGRTSSGPAPGGTTIDWGDDATDDAVDATAEHVYEKSGSVVVLVRAMDVAGNVTNVRRRLTVRAAAGKRPTTTRGADGRPATAGPAPHVTPTPTGRP
jgi:hypothetical protein